MPINTGLDENTDQQRVDAMLGGCCDRFTGKAMRKVHGKPFLNITYNNADLKTGVIKKAKQ